MSEGVPQDSGQTNAFPADKDENEEKNEKKNEDRNNGQATAVHVTGGAGGVPPQGDGTGKFIRVHKDGTTERTNNLKPDDNWPPEHN